MTKPLIITPMVWDSVEERETIHRHVNQLRLDVKVLRKIDEVDTPTAVKVSLGRFEATYHSFEKVVEVLNEDKAFRFVFGPNYLRIDGNKHALKRWLMVEKLSN